jgi:hypothetical protein
MTREFLGQADSTGALWWYESSKSKQGATEHKIKQSGVG